MSLEQVIAQNPPKLVLQVKGGALFDGQVASLKSVLDVRWIRLIRRNKTKWKKNTAVTLCPCVLVGGLEHDFFSIFIRKVIIPIDELIFFRRVGIPPTSVILTKKMDDYTYIIHILAND